MTLVKQWLMRYNKINCNSTHQPRHREREGGRQRQRREKGATGVRAVKYEILLIMEMKTKTQILFSCGVHNQMSWRKMRSRFVYICALFDRKSIYFNLLLAISNNISYVYLFKVRNICEMVTVKMARFSCMFHLQRISNVYILCLKLMR